MPHTPGPWRWELNRKSRRLQLCGGVPRFDLTIMDFVRWGMNGAVARFREPDKDHMNIMHRADEYGVDAPNRSHHADWFQLLNHPDARLMEAAPTLLAACEAVKRWIEEDTLVDLDELSEDAKEILETVRAAIAAATGVSNA